MSKKPEWMKVRDFKYTFADDTGTREMICLSCGKLQAQSYNGLEHPMGYRKGWYCKDCEENTVQLISDGFSPEEWEEARTNWQPYVSDLQKALLDLDISRQRVRFLEQELLTLDGDFREVTARAEKAETEADLLRQRVRDLEAGIVKRHAERMAPKPKKAVPPPAHGALAKARQKWTDCAPITEDSDTNWFESLT